MPPRLCSTSSQRSGWSDSVSTLVFLEHHGNELSKASLGVLSKAATLGDSDVAAVVVGTGVRALAEEAGKFGAGKVYVADDAQLEAPLPQPRVDALAQLIRDKQIDTVLFANSVLAADIAAGLAARLDAGVNWDLTDLIREDGKLIGKRPALQDSVYVDVGWTSEPCLALFRSGSFDPSANGGPAEVEDVQVSLEDFSTAAKMVDQAHEESEGPSIEDAQVIVAGGRGLGGPENFTLVEELAKALGGAVGATRAVVDAGWYPYSTQVGQTGKTVSPKLYIACGISGAIQHKVGMQSSGVIVAINKDPNAPIFEFSDLGVVGDVHQVVPKLTELVKQRKSQ
jgi:electron transfer flavoprotein alpha subunit